MNIVTRLLDFELDFIPGNSLQTTDINLNIRNISSGEVVKFNLECNLFHYVNSKFRRLINF